MLTVDQKEKQVDNNTETTSIRRTQGTAQVTTGRRLPLGLGQVAAHGFLIAIVLVDLLPLVWMALGSFKQYGDLVHNFAFPNPWTLANYVELVSRVNFLQAFRNSVLVAVPIVFLACFTSAAVGYVFAKYRFPGRDLLFTLLLSTMMVPFVVTLVPLYVTLADLGLINKLGALIILGVFSTIGTFMLRQSINDIPDELIQAARVDGAGEIWIYRHIIIPLSKAPLAALATFTFLWTWDDYMLPSIVIRDPSTQTLPLLLAGLRHIYHERYELYVTGGMLTVVPVMLLYLAMRRHFIRGIALSGLKG